MDLRYIMGAYSCKSSANSNYVLLNEHLNALCHALNHILYIGEMVGRLHCVPCDSILIDYGDEY